MKRKLARKLKQKMVAGPTMIQGAEEDAAEAEAEAEVAEEAAVEVIKVISKAIAITAELGVTRKLLVGTNLRTHICVMLITGPCRIKKQRERI